MSSALLGWPIEGLANLAWELKVSRVQALIGASEARRGEHGRALAWIKKSTTTIKGMLLYAATLWTTGALMMTDASIDSGQQVERRIRSNIGKYAKASSNSPSRSRDQHFYSKPNGPKIQILHANACTHTHTHAHVDAHAHAHAHTYARVYIPIDIYIHIYTSVHMNIYLYTYTPYRALPKRALPPAVCRPAATPPEEARRPSQDLPAKPGNRPLRAQERSKTSFVVKTSGATNINRKIDRLIDRQTDR